MELDDKLKKYVIEDKLGSLLGALADVMMIKNSRDMLTMTTFHGSKIRGKGFNEVWYARKTDSLWAKGKEIMSKAPALIHLL